MKSIYKIKVHPLFYIFAFVAILTGLFREFLIFTFIIIVHECGHILAGYLFKIYPERIIILPFGGLTIFNMKVNTLIYKELFIALMGPIVQIIVWIIISYFHYNIIYNKYNLFILIFNLLPIYPLDGSKIFNCIVNKLICFRKSFLLTIYMSFISISVFIFFVFFKHLSLGWLLIISFLLIKIIDEFFNFKNIFNKFLWERYNYNLGFKKEKYINSIFFMKKDYRHIFKIGNQLKNEKEVLEKRFDFKRKA